MECWSFHFTSCERNKRDRQIKGILSESFFLLLSTGYSRRGCSLHRVHWVPPCGSCMSAACSRVLGSGLHCRRFQAAAASECTLAFSWVLVFLSVGAFLILMGWFLAFCGWFLALCGRVVGLRIKNMWWFSLTHYSCHGVPACVFPQLVEDGAELSLGTAAAACLVAQTAGAYALDVSASLVNMCVHEDELDREDRPNTAGCLSAGSGDWGSGRVHVPGSVPLAEPCEMQQRPAVSRPWLFLWAGKP